MTRKVYLYPADGYLVQRLGSTLKERGYEVFGGHAKPEAPAFLSASYQIGSQNASATSRQFLAKADVVIYELHGHEKAARDAVVHMAKQPFGGRQQLYIGVSTPLVWAAARPAPPEEEVDVPDSASVFAATVGGGLRGTSDHASIVGARGLSRAVSTMSTANMGTPGVADAYAIAAATGALTDRAASRRAPCLSARDVYELEQLIVRCQRKGKLRTSVVCPGLLYGCGESVLHGVMQQAWQLSKPLKVYGNGNNHLPMMHVDDCAAYLAALCGTPEQGGDALMAGLPETLQYLIAVDSPALGTPGGALQGHLIQELAKRLGNGLTSTVASEQLLFIPHVEQWTLNTPLVCTPLPSGAAYQPHYSQGILHHIDDVIQQWRDVRGVNPLRITLSGAPMAGKSTIAARLAALYKLPVITAKDLLASSDKLTPEDAKALSQELNGKDGRASGRSMASLLRAVVLGNKTAVNRGYILDAYPKTSGQAKWAFMKLAPLTAEEVADKEKDELSSRVSTPATAKGAAAKPAPAKKEAKKDTKPGAADSGPDVPAGFKLVADTAMAPTHLIQVNASPTELAVRRAEVERQELATARSATPSEALKTGKGGKDKAGSASHNNEKDFARRMAAWTQICADEAADLEAQVAAAKAQWAKQQAEQAAERERMEAEARTLRARRRRAREEAAQMTTAGLLASSQTLQGSATPTTMSSALQTQQLNGIDSAQGAENDVIEEDVAQAPLQEPTLPQFGGLAGVLASLCGTQVLNLENSDVNDGIPITPTSWDIRNEQGPADDGIVTLEGLEQQLKGFLGPTRNFEGFPQHTRQTVSGVAGGFVGATSTDAQKVQLLVQQQQQQALQQDEAERQQLAEEAARQAALSLAAKHGDVADPVRRFIMSEVMPTVTDALRLICTDRKADPLRFLAHHLLRAADEWESHYVDPYIDPRYEQQRVKLREKQARDAARELAAQQKADRELAAKQAAKLAEQEAEALAAAAALQEQEARLAREAISKQDSIMSNS